ncbi:MAG: hypothetical protein WEB59_16185 [Thermoanaerobaculia bacterium]
MKFRRLFPAVLVAAGLAVPAASEVASKKFDWRPINGIQEIDLRDGDIVINEVEFDLGSILKGTPIRKSSAKVKIRIDNNGKTNQEVGAAVVVFDAEGNVVAAGSNGTKWGYLNKGDRTYYTIDFPYVYRRLDQAASFLVTIETRGKGNRASRSYQSQSSTGSVESEPLPTPVP